MWQGIIILVIGVVLLIISIPFSLLTIFLGVIQLTQSDLSGGILAYAGIAGVVAGFVLTAIGAVKVFKR